MTEFRLSLASQPRRKEVSAGKPLDVRSELRSRLGNAFHRLGRSQVGQGGRDPLAGGGRASHLGVGLGIQFCLPEPDAGRGGKRSERRRCRDGAQDAREGSSRGAWLRRQSPRRPAGRAAAGEVGSFRVPLPSVFNPRFPARLARKRGGGVMAWFSRCQVRFLPRALVVVIGCRRR